MKCALTCVFGVHDTKASSNCHKGKKLPTTSMKAVLNTCTGAPKCLGTRPYNPPYATFLWPSLVRTQDTQACHQWERTPWCCRGPILSLHFRPQASLKEEAGHRTRRILTEAGISTSSLSSASPSATGHFSIAEDN